MNKTIKGLVVLSIVFFLLGGFCYFLNYATSIKKVRIQMMRNGMVLEYATNLPIQNPDGQGQWRIYGDIITARQGGTVTRIGQVDGKSLVWYEPRFLSNEEPSYRGAIFLWDTEDYDRTVARQQALRAAVSNSLAGVSVLTK